MEGNKKTLYFRSAVVMAIVLLLAGYFWYLSYDAIVNNAVPQSESNRINMITTSETVSAARGDITDRYGRVLVTNKTEYVVTLDVESMGDVDDQTAVIQRLIEICKEQDIEWTDKEFPVSQDTPYEFTTDNPYQVVEDGKTSQTRLSRLLEAEENEWGYSGIPAENLVNNMRRFFQIPDSMSDKEAREILGVLYSCYLRKDEILWTDYYFAEDVDIDFISVVKEEDLPGVNIKATTARQYNTDYAAVLLGQTGAISAEKWEELQAQEDNPYNMNDIIGLSGVESAFEKYLKGTDGTLLTTYDTDGAKMSEEYTTAPVAGNNVALTLDIGLQEAVEKSLNERTDQINDAVTGSGSAAVVIDIHSGEVLAAASYPTYSAVTYLEDYEELVQNDRNPLYNRAFLGTYAPGSTYKMCTATAAYNAGVIDTSTTVNCSGSMRYGDTTFNCWHQAGHGSEQLDDAVRDSCNIYFYTVGAETGIEKETETALAYGLGEHTGIELTENTGVNAGPEYSEKVGTIWYPGNVLSASIGQSDNQFTPLQLVNYVATLVNGGTRYNAHLLKNVKSHDNSSIICTYEDTVDSSIVGTVPLADVAREAIIKGMSEVIAADKIKDFDDLIAKGIEVGCKTGTAQLGNTGRNNGLFVAFAPLDDPEIAICTVVEKAASGASTAGITADIMEYYFSEEATLERVEAENALLR